MRHGLLCVALILAANTPAIFAQHEGHTMPPPKPARPKPAATPARPKPAATPARPKPAPSPQMPETADEPVHMDHGVFVMHGDQMSIRVGQNESNLMPMGRMGSGTSWQPASSQMSMLHKQSGEWLLM